MREASTISKLVRIAQKLEDQGHYMEADDVMDIVMRLAQQADSTEDKIFNRPGAKMLQHGAWQDTGLHNGPSDPRYHSFQGNPTTKIGPPPVQGTNESTQAFQTRLQKWNVDRAKANSSDIVSIMRNQGKQFFQTADPSAAGQQRGRQMSQQWDIMGSAPGSAADLQKNTNPEFAQPLGEYPLPPADPSTAGWAGYPTMTPYPNPKRPLFPNEQGNQ